VNENEPGDVFYFVEEGELIAYKKLNPNKPDVEVKRYHELSYFGELCLIQNTPR